MIMRRTYVCILMLLAALTLAFAACGGDSKKSGSATFSDNPTAISGVPTAAAAFPLTVQRSDGKGLTLPAVPKRIVSLSPAATETLYAIGAEGSLAAVDKLANYPDAAKNFSPKVDAFEPNVETIAALKPDLVIVANDTNGIVGKLDELKIPVLFSDIDKTVTTVEDVFSQIGLLGTVTGTTAKSAPLIENLAGRLRKIRDAVQGVDTTQAPKIYHELDSTYYTASNASFVGDLYHILRVRNIAGDGGGRSYPQLTQEAIIAANPKVIILADEDFGVTVDSVKQRPGWDAIDAVKNNKVFGVNADIISRPGPRIIDALEQLAKAIFPQRFS